MATIMLSQHEQIINKNTPPSRNYSLHRIRTMNSTTFKSIASRARYQLRLLNEGYSRGDSHRKHIMERFQYFGSLDKEKGDYITCDRCQKNIEFGSAFYIHRRRSYNRFFHMDCANTLNLL